MDQTLLHELRLLLPNCLRHDRLRLEQGVDRLHALPSPARLPLLRRLLAEASRSVGLRHRRHERLPQVEYPSSLPITAARDDILAALRGNQVVIIAGETGSGKTTQIPKMCLEAGLGVDGKIACTQPRRVAALSISRRIAQELKVAWGREVGCKIRFSDQSSPETYIKLMTDGILLAETQGDPDLNEYDAVVIDEAHERSLNIDFLLGHLQLLLPRRPDLKLIITSATIDTNAFSQAFGGAPIVEVSGRLFPVEIRYAPHDPEAEESGDLTYIDAAVNAVETVLGESAQGDILIFMPGERDIRETQEDLQGRCAGRAEIVPLFGRLTSGEQERVFAPSPRRKIIIATNIAETSLTIPGIRYVIDPGLARMSRYSPRTRTKRLPIEAISQSSANQRAGRSGRVENGVCVRLYSEEDFNARPPYTQPEIQRANLAEVILRMKAWRLGEIEVFPFINPPQPPAINAGYQLLQELGALDENRKLTPLGRDIARLPVDPAVGRMVLQSAREGALDEVLVIAAGLSIQDPRERPLEKQGEADEAHRQFLDPDSDFLALLKIWHAFHDKLESLKTQNQMRRFCQAHFLSYPRMREWRDIHAQLRDSLREVLDLAHHARAGPRSGKPGNDPDERREGSRLPHSPLPGPGPKAGRTPSAAARPQDRNESPSQHANYAGIHRSILAGLLGHVAQRAERNVYRASGNRQLMVFPGSSLFDRNEKTSRAKRAHDPPVSAPTQQKPRQPEWLVAGEIVETSRLYARTVARIRPEWIVELGGHICKRSYSEPHWSREAGRVLARERITLLGLEVQESDVDYGRVNAKEATEIFIRSALVQEDLESPAHFLQHNRQIRQKIEVWRTRTREHRLPDLDQILFEFYAGRLENVSSVHDLNRLLRDRAGQEANFLCATDSDLTGGQELGWDTAAFPAEVNVEEHRVPLEYAYAPGEAHDGITIKLPATLAHAVQPGMLDWIVPGLREEQVEFLLKALPKAVRVPLMPIAPKVKELAAALQGGEDLNALRRWVRQKYGVQIPSDAWKRELLPDYLRPRVAITAKNGQVIVAGRDLEKLKHGLETHETPAEQKAWLGAVQRWERYDLSGWPCADLPERLEVTQMAGAPLYAFPAFLAEEDTVHLKLFRKKEEAEKAMTSGYVELVARVLQREFAWLQKDLRALDKIRNLYVTLGPGEELLSTAYANLKRHLITLPFPLLPLTRGQFERSAEEAKARMSASVSALVDRVGAILRLRQELLLHRKPYPTLRRDLDSLVPPRFLEKIDCDRLQHLPRYLKALAIRADRAALNGAKDEEKARQVQPYTEAVQKLRSQTPSPSPATERAIDDFRWMVEEFKVSWFAQELGTAQPVSAKRLDAQWQLLQERCS